MKTLITTSDGPKIHQSGTRLGSVSVLVGGWGGVTHGAKHSPSDLGADFPLRATSATLNF